ncbi:28217604-de8e-436d-9543-2a82e46d631c [Thermothielavioides terrestris]|uniref:28217604-de8e-436d-9543-2a82e46d631c n=1 Tax=Thermothielavioides terrestris TaxID=2587410 RepID=A0A446BQN7_9PEZI|nr:28217604-de8e-436d-9543-2a82e46d631c [Thermothielavioides terrestris]
MASTGDDQYHPKDAIHSGLYGAVTYGGVGLLFAAVRNSLAKKNVGPWTTFTRNTSIIATFAAAGGVYEFARDASANLRETDDHWNHGIGGFLAGAVVGLRTGRIPRIVGCGLLTSVVLATYEYTGASLRGYWKSPEVDEYERKEMLRKNRRRPIEETLAEIGEGRGIRPPGYEERRRARLKEKYGIDINPVCADPDAA